MPGCWIVWSDELLDEAKNTLIKLKPLQPHVAEAWVGHMRREFPTGKADISEIPEGLDLSTLTTDPTISTCALSQSPGRRTGCSPMTGAIYVRRWRVTASMSPLRTSS